MLPNGILRIKKMHRQCPSAPDVRSERVALVTAKEIKDNKYDQFNRYYEPPYEEIHYEPPGHYLDELEKLENEILADLKELRGMLG